MNKVIFENQNLTPSKVVCIGRNYVDHIEELGNDMPDNMVIFNKANSAITDQLRYFGDQCRFEGEICLLIQKGKIAGIGLGLDLTRADIQSIQKKKGLPWERAKSFDGSAVLSKFIPLQGDISDINFKLHINNKLTQEADYDLMIYKPSEMIHEIESFMTLEDNDIIMTGTPKGVGNYRAGNRFTMQLFDGKELLLEQKWVAI
ncbi:MAG: fumarylacetoacetate hydrolase family protein [Sulfurovum sp.]|nr:fumarylacetoacetate hydrolase family protein [Sulfurovum sp.]